MRFAVAGSSPVRTAKVFIIERQKGNPVKRWFCGIFFMAISQVAQLGFLSQATSDQG